MMTPTLAPPRLTHDEYFALELATEYPNEYRAGEIVPIDDTEVKASLIKTNLICALNPDSCPAINFILANFRVWIPARDAYLYPDVSVMVGEGFFESYNDETDTLLNPALVIDVVSPRRAHADPDWRAEAYRSLDFIREYVRLAYDHPQVEVYRRGEDGGWVLRESADQLESSFFMESIGLTLPMDEVYDGVLDARQRSRGTRAVPGSRDRGNG